VVLGQPHGVEANGLGQIHFAQSGFDDLVILTPIRADREYK